MGVTILPKILYNTPLLAGKSKTDGIKFWQGFVAEREDGVIVRGTQYWERNLQGIDSKTITSAPTVVEAKNIGKTNETDPYDQALSEINSEFNKKVDSGYAVYREGEAIKDRKAGDGKIAPQLAEDYLKLTDKKKESIRFPRLAQPKYDGFRALHKDSLGLYWSRNGKDNIPEVTQHINLPQMDWYWDGELMLPLELLAKSGYDNIFQATSKLVKKYRSAETNEVLKYYVFDFYDPTDPQIGCLARWNKLKKILTTSNTKSVELVPTFLVNNWDEVEKAQQYFIDLGFEGAMLKDPDAPYQIGQRSTAWLKVKEFIDEEFICIDVVDGKGKKEGVATFVCKTKDGKVFNPDPIGTLESSRKIFEEKDKWIGKMITVKHQPPYYQDGTPRFPKAKPVLRSEIE